MRDSEFLTSSNLNGLIIASIFFIYCILQNIYLLFTTNSQITFENLYNLKKND
jgi:hypothetical protein